jgi:hypothetical protein
VIRIETKKETNGEVSKVTPRTFGDAKEIADHLKANSPVIVNLEEADADLQRRMIDFCSGVAYALGGRMERIARVKAEIERVNIEVQAAERDYDELRRMAHWRRMLSNFDVYEFEWDGHDVRDAFDEPSDLARLHRVRSVPTVLFFGEF